MITNRSTMSSFIALVNKGNCLFSTGQYDKAHDYYQEALRFALLLHCVYACGKYVHIWYKMLLRLNTGKCVVLRTL